MSAEEDRAAAKVQSMKRGNDARQQVKEGKSARKVQSMQRGKKSRKGGDALVHVIETANFARFEKMIESGAEATPDALRAALKSPIRAFGSMLVSNQSTWGVNHKMLDVWNRVQKALNPPPPGEDEEEPEEVDVSSEEWQAELATAVYKEDPDGKFLVQQVVALGCYSISGGRQVHDATKEKEFDTAVTAREGYGVALMPKGAVYAGSFVADAREGNGVYKYTDSTCYCGEWKGNQKHGEGRMVFKDGSVYEGAWRYNKRHGHGVYTYTNGDIYYGMWFTGAKHGKVHPSPSSFPPPEPRLTLTLTLTLNPHADSDPNPNPGPNPRPNPNPAPQPQPGQVPLRLDGLAIHGGVEERAAGREHGARERRLQVLQRVRGRRALGCGRLCALQRQPGEGRAQPAAQGGGRGGRGGRAAQGVNVGGRRGGRRRPHERRAARRAVRGGPAPAEESPRHRHHVW